MGRGQEVPEVAAALFARGPDNQNRRSSWSVIVLASYNIPRQARCMIKHADQITL